MLPLHSNLLPNHISGSFNVSAHLHPTAPNCTHTIATALHCVRILNLESATWNTNGESKRAEACVSSSTGQLPERFLVFRIQRRIICIPAHASQPSKTHSSDRIPHTESLDHSPELRDGLGTLRAVDFLSFLLPFPQYDTMYYWCVIISRSGCSTARPTDEK